MQTKAIKINTINSKATSRQKMIYMTSTALFAALICITTAYIFHIPFGVNGGYVHVGDALIYLAAAILPTPYALAAGALGGAFADLLTAPIWAPATFLIKMLIAIPFTCKKNKIINIHNVIGVFIAALLSTTGYAVAEAIILGDWGVVIPVMIGSLVQAFSSAVLFITFGHALDKIRFKTTLKTKFGL